jgi:hypothetical protein
MQAGKLESFLVLPKLQLLGVPVPAGLLLCCPVVAWVAHCGLLLWYWPSGPATGLTGCLPQLLGHRVLQCLAVC